MIMNIKSLTTYSLKSRKRITNISHLKRIFFNGFWYKSPAFIYLLKKITKKGITVYQAYIFQVLKKVIWFCQHLSMKGRKMDKRKFETECKLIEMKLGMLLFIWKTKLPLTDFYHCRSEIMIPYKAHQFLNKLLLLSNLWPY